jgi:hypothetical protein
LSTQKIDNHIFVFITVYYQIFKNKKGLPTSLWELVTHVSEIDEAIPPAQDFVYVYVYEKYASTLEASYAFDGHS